MFSCAQLCSLLYFGFQTFKLRDKIYVPTKVEGTTSVTRLWTLQQFVCPRSQQLCGHANFASCNPPFSEYCYWKCKHTQVLFFLDCSIKVSERLPNFTVNVSVVIVVSACSMTADTMSALSKMSTQLMTMLAHVCVITTKLTSCTCSQQVTRHQVSVVNDYAD